MDANGISEIPIPKGETPDESILYFLVRSHADFLPYGENIVNENLFVGYLDFDLISKMSYISKPPYRKVRATGADVQATYDAHLVGEMTGQILELPKALSPEGANFIQVDIRIENIGSDIAYYPTANIYLGAGVTVMQNEERNYNVLTNDEGERYVQISLEEDLGPGDTVVVPLQLRYEKPLPETSWIDSIVPKVHAQEGGPESAEIINRVEVEFDLTDIENENRVNQKTAVVR